MVDLKDMTVEELTAAISETESEIEKQGADPYHFRHLHRLKGLLSAELNRRRISSPRVDS